MYPIVCSSLRSATGKHDTGDRPRGVSRLEIKYPTTVAHTASAAIFGLPGRSCVLAPWMHIADFPPVASDTGPGQHFETDRLLKAI